MLIYLPIVEAVLSDKQAEDYFNLYLFLISMIGCSVINYTK